MTMTFGTFPSLRVLARTALVAVCLVAGAVSAHEFTVAELKLVHPWSPPSLAGSKNGVAFVVAIENAGRTADALQSASSPVAGRVELHTMAMDQGVMRMRQVDGIAVPARGKVEMKPKMGYHLMLMELKEPLVAGRHFPMTLVFEKAGPVQVTVTVQDRPAEAAAAHPH